MACVTELIEKAYMLNGKTENVYSLLLLEEIHRFLELYQIEVKFLAAIKGKLINIYFKERKFSKILPLITGYTKQLITNSASKKVTIDFLERTLKFFYIVFDTPIHDDDYYQSFFYKLESLSPNRAKNIDDYEKMRKRCFYPVKRYRDYLGKERNEITDYCYQHPGFVCFSKRSSKKFNEMCVKGGDLLTAVIKRFIQKIKQTTEYTSTLFYSIICNRNLSNVFDFIGGQDFSGNDVKIITEKANVIKGLIFETFNDEQKHFYFVKIVFVILRFGIVFEKKIKSLKKEFICELDEYERNFLPQQRSNDDDEKEYYKQVNLPEDLK